MTFSRKRIESRPVESRLVVAISSRALFDLEQSHRLFTEQGIDAYCRYQIEHENELLEPGVAFPLVCKLLGLNTRSQHKTRVEVVLISRNSADTGLRIFHSIQHYKLDISRAAFTSGISPYRYVEPFQAQLFLSADPEDVRQALDDGFAAATILPGHASTRQQRSDVQLRIAFDGDAVLFADDAERVYKQQGLQAFVDAERAAADQPLPGGPFKGVLQALQALQAEYSGELSPLRTALVTSRAAPAHERAVKTLRAWKIRIDEVLFLGGLDKGEFLRTFGADIFFDDQSKICDQASQHVPTGHVPSGIANPLDK